MPPWPLTIFSISWSCFLLITKKLSKLNYFREEENLRFCLLGYVPWHKSNGVGEAFSIQRQCSPTSVSYSQCTADAHSNFLLICTPMEASFFPNPLGQMTYFSSLFLPFDFRISEKFFLKIWALLPTCLTNTNNKNQCAVWISRHSKSRENLYSPPTLWQYVL